MRKRYINERAVEKFCSAVVDGRFQNESDRKNVGPLVDWKHRILVAKKKTEGGPKKSGGGGREINDKNI